MKNYYGYLLFILLITTYFCSYGQVENEKIPKSSVLKSLNIGIGVQSANGSSISKVYSVGYCLEIGLDFNVYSNRFIVSPVYSFDYFGSYFSDAVLNNLYNNKFGFFAKYEFSSSKFKYYPLLEFGFNNVENTLTSRSGYIGDPIDILSGSGFSNGIGFGFYIKSFDIKFVYNHFKPVVSIDNEISILVNQVSDIYTLISFMRQNWI